MPLIPSPRYLDRILERHSRRDVGHAETAERSGDFEKRCFIGCFEDRDGYMPADEDVATEHLYAFGISEVFPQFADSFGVVGIEFEP